MNNINHEQVIQTKRLLIRPFNLNDASNLFDNLDSNPSVVQYTGGLKNKEESLKRLANIINSQEHTPFVPRGVILEDVNELIGWVGLEPFMLNKEQIEVAFGIAQKHWGNGYATEAAKAILKMGFCQYKLNLIVAAVNPQNIASMKVINKLGFTYKNKISWLNQGLVNYYILAKTNYLEHTEKKGHSLSNGPNFEENKNERNNKKIR